MAKKGYFTPKLFKFLTALGENNNREWFHENKGRYEEEVRDPMLRFIEDFAGPLRKISPHFIADPRANGGSMFRIYRDTRFSKDKTPYKTSASAHFRHERARDAHAPGYFLQLEPDRVFCGCGIWRPDSGTLTKVRDAIVLDPKAWKSVISRKALKAAYTVGGNSLKRPPKGYDPDHPLIEDLKLKDYVAVRNFTRKETCAHGFMEVYIKTCRAATPFMRYLTEALDLEW